MCIMHDINIFMNILYLQETAIFLQLQQQSVTIFSSSLAVESREHGAYLLMRIIYFIYSPERIWDGQWAIVLLFFSKYYDQNLQ